MVRFRRARCIRSLMTALGGAAVLTVALTGSGGDGSNDRWHRS
jgi:hypothetical protein